MPSERTILEGIRKRDAAAKSLARALARLLGNHRPVSDREAKMFSGCLYPLPTTRRKVRDVQIALERYERFALTEKETPHA